MLEGEPWRARVLDAVDADDFEFAPYRAVFEALAEDSPERLDDTSARTFEQLRAEGLGGRLPDEVLAGAIGWIEARGLQRQVESIEREIPLANEHDQIELLRQKMRLSAEMNARHPKWKALTKS
jgi:hypothetical protein